MFRVMLCHSLHHIHPCTCSVFPAGLRALDIVLYGDKSRKYKVKIGKEGENKGAFTGDYETNFEGVIPNLERRYLETDSDYVRKKIENFMRILRCPSCKGQRLKAEILAVNARDDALKKYSHITQCQLLEDFIVAYSK